MSKAAISIEGFISNELEFRDAGTHRVVEVSVPVTPSKKDESGQWVNDDANTVWYRATFWNEHADVLTQTVQKGSLVTLTGTPELEVFAKRDGTPGAKIRVGNPVIAAVVRKPKRGENRTSSTPTTEQWAAPATTPASTGGFDSFEDSTPF